MHALTTSLKHISVESFLAHVYQSNVDLLGTMEMLMSRKRGFFGIKLKIKQYLSTEFHLTVLEMLTPAIYQSQQ